MLRKLRKKKGQSTLEYIILVAVIIAVLAIFLPNIFSQRYSGTMELGANGMVNMANRLYLSH